MTTASPTKIDNKYNIYFLLALIVAGLAGNYLGFPIFHNTDFLFGSIFTMLALQFFGPGRGILAAVIISSYTWFLWNHPYAIICMTAEVAVVGWLMNRRKMGIVLADSIYWVIVGIPLTYLFTHILMHLALSNSCFIMIKQAVNGIANVLVARIIFTVFALRFRSALTSFRDVVYNLLSFFVLFPILAIMSLDSRNDFIETDRRIRISLIQVSKRLDQDIQNWLDNRKSAIVNLADMAASRTPQQMQPYLEQAMKSDLNFKRIGLQDREATSTAFFPVLDILGQSAIGRSYADRSYISALKLTLKPMLSDVEMSKFGIPKPRVVMLAPVLIQGEFGGYVAGILNLDRIHKHLDNNRDEYATFYTLIDKNSNVIITNRTDQKVMTPFMRGKGMLNSLDNGVSQWLPAVPPNTALSERWKKSFYVTETIIGDLAEWKLILEQPVEPFQKMLYDNYSRKLFLLFLILLVALSLAELLSRWIVISLEKLCLITRDLPVRLASGSSINWPESIIKETNDLISNFNEMTVSLEQQTKKLRESEEKYRLLFDNANDAVFIVDTQARILAINPRAVERLGYTHSELLSMTVNQLDPPEQNRYTQERITRLMEQGHLTFETVNQCKDGSLIPVEVSARVITWAGHPAIMGVSRDITERKKAHQYSLKAMAGLVSAIAHQWRQPLATLGMIVQRSHAETTMHGLTSGYMDEFKANAMRQIRYMSDTIEEFRGFYSTDKMKVPFSPLSCINEAVRLLDTQITNSGIVVDIHCPDCDNQLANGIPNELKQVILNLLGNARNAILESRKTTGKPEAGRISILISLSVNLESVMIIDISDNGCGVPDDIASRIFEPYYSSRKEEGGTGLGLYMSRIILEYSMEGRLNLIQGEEGATFRIELPLEKLS